MDAKVIFYSMKNLEPKVRTKVLEKLLGKSKKSNFGKYVYQVTGLIPEGSYIKPVRAVLIIKKRYLTKVLKLFDFYDMEYIVFDIIVEKGDFDKKHIFLN
ncbi:MAG: hypothetical protein HeimC3_01270 [Candidatus Heimdallarchaeota archaeon LC_3]|nr:MAG: hypothetical protein HeimC3_01270 [Candidatus Heimdallarchaeota archaeon LC_3]